MDGGSINLVLPEVKIDLDDDGKVAGAHTVDNTESHQVIEEFMLAANEAVAQHMCDLKLPYMRRIHAHPTEKKLQALTEFVQALGVECDSLQDRFEMKRVVEDLKAARKLMRFTSRFFVVCKKQFMAPTRSATLRLIARTTVTSHRRSGVIRT